MKAYVLHAVNNFLYEEVEFPTCQTGWAIVQVKAAGICSSDIARVFTKGTYHFPTIPGHEFSGKVVAVGDEKDAEWVDKRVGVFPLIPCHKCPQCADKHYEMCEDYDYVGSRRDGGFAEYVAVPVWNLLEIPPSMEYTSAAMLEPISVALHAIKIGGIKRGDTVAVVGTGMIGIGAAQWATLYGASSVTVIGRSESKRELVETSGLTYQVCTNMKEIGLFDVVLEAVGTQDSIEMALSAATPGGTVLLMGNPSSDIRINQQVYWRILRKQLLVKGTWNSSFDGLNPSDWTESVQAISNNTLKIDALISHQFEQNQLINGLKLMAEHQEPFCKVMTLWNK